MAKSDSNRSGAPDTHGKHPPFRLDRPQRGIAKRAFSALVNPAVERALAFHRLNAVYDDVCQNPTDDHFAEKVLESLKVTVDVSARELERIPKTGPLIVVANHPFGAVDGMILMSILHRARPDAKVMANFLLARIEELREMLICVDPFEGDGAKARNLGPLKDAIRHVKSGGALGCFPAGEVAHLDLQKRAIVDPPWSETIAGIVRRTGATVVPLYFHGRNSPLFQLLGMIHPRLRTVMLPRELLRKHHRKIRVKVGHPIPANRLKQFPDDRRTVDYLRMRTYLQAAGFHKRRERGSPPSGQPESESKYAEIIPAVDPGKLADEIAALPARCQARRSRRPGRLRRPRPSDSPVPARDRPVAGNLLPGRRRGHG
jgi:putative hemolysin